MRFRREGAREFLRYPLGDAMDELAIRKNAKSQRQFENGLNRLAGKTHWSSGEWNFGTECRPWHALQNTKADYRLVSQCLVRHIRRAN